MIKTAAMLCSLVFTFCVLLSLIVSNDAIRQRTLLSPRSKVFENTSESSIINSNLVPGRGDADGQALLSHTENNKTESKIPYSIEESSPFLLVAENDRISRINLADYKLDEVPLRGLNDVTAIEFDMKNNCLYWTEFHRNSSSVGDFNCTISRQCFKDGLTEAEILVETDLGIIYGMALDWVSNVLYFVDGMEMKIQLVRTDINTQDRMRRTVIGSHNLYAPYGIAVHPKAGYMFWTERFGGYAEFSISRANLDGTNVRRLQEAKNAHRLTIDYIAERIYWVDNGDYTIYSSDFDGKGFKRFAHGKYPLAIAVFENNVYWYNWHKSMISVADKDHGAGITSIISNLALLYDLKVFGHGVQTGLNQCASNPCPYICLGAPNDTYVCLCPDSMVANATGHCVCPGGLDPFANSTCPRVEASCLPNQFLCDNGFCIPDFLKCNGDNDCGDQSDEKSCPTCDPDEFGCDRNKCIPRNKLCNHYEDCLDGKDEYHCFYSNCSDSQFKCNNGLCISHQRYCDGEYDCLDLSDEKSCTSGVMVWEKERIVSMTIEEHTITSSSFTLSWSVVGNKNDSIEYMPSIVKIDEPFTWTNATDWTQELHHRFTDLEPYTSYHAFVYSRRNTKVAKPHWYVTARTLEGVPSEPLNVTVTQKNGTDAEVTWQPPQHPRGIITDYIVTYSPPSTAAQICTKETFATVKMNPVYGYNFTFWVIAQNQFHKSSPSAKVNLLLEGVAV